MDELAVSRKALRQITRREVILQVAQQHFLKGGYAATTMSTIAERLGGSKATLWSYFPSKEALFHAVIARAAASFRRELAGIFEIEKNVEDTLMHFCRAFIMRIISGESLALRRVVIAEAERFPEVGQVFHEEVRGPVQGVLVEYLGESIRIGALRRADPDEAAEVLISLCHGRCFRRAIFGLSEELPLDDIEADARLALDLFMAGYAKISRQGARAQECL